MFNSVSEALQYIKSKNHNGDARPAAMQLIFGDPVTSLFFLRECKFTYEERQKAIQTVMLDPTISLSFLLYCKHTDSEFIDVMQTVMKDNHLFGSYISGTILTKERKQLIVEILKKTRNDANARTCIQTNIWGQEQIDEFYGITVMNALTKHN